MIIPAIDIKEGKVVRLFKGRFDQVTEYGTDPVSMARFFEAAGALYLHVVDLDGARTGQAGSRDIIKRMVKEIRIPLETGGGIRDLETITDLLDAGVARVVLGTRAVEDRGFLRSALAAFGEKIAVSLDCLNGMAARRGWVETSSQRGIDLAREFADMGLKYIIYTDISRDGALTGPDMDGLREMLSLKDVNVIASGGIKDIADIKALLALKSPNMYGVITGKAVYEKTLDLKQALKLC